MSKYSSLSEKYGGFCVPAYKITCGGSELKRTEFMVSDIAVDNCVGKTAGASRFTVCGVYEAGSRQFNADAQRKLAPGTKVSVSLGYGSDTTEVFTGYIDELKIQFDEERASLTAICLDARGLMRRGSSYAAVKDKELKAVVTAVLDKYGALVTSKDITLAKWEQNVNVTQAGCDLDFVCGAADLRGALFYIDCGKAVIGAANDKICVEFDRGQPELDFSVRYLDETLVAYGYDSQNMKPFKAEASAKQAAKQEKLITVKNEFRLPYYFNADSAKAHADSLASVKISEALSGTIRSVGLPELKVGQRVKINKLPLASLGVSDSLTVKSVSHRIDNQNGFTTEIEVTG